MKRKADPATLPVEGGKDSAAAAAGSKKRKLSEPDDFVALNTEKEARKKAKKEKKEKKDKKDKSEKSEKSEKSSDKSEKKEKSKDKSKDKKEKKEKKDKKRKAEASEDVVDAETQPAPAALNGDADEVPVKKEKKDKKDKKSKKEKKAKGGSATDGADTTKVPVKEEAEAEAVDGAEEQQSGKREKYIVFIGNLPYSATADSVREHFASVKPTSVRLLTHRDNPSKSKGIAFMEFGTYGHMKSCLEHFHHSEFNDGVSPARKINVELTAGGGGKKEARQEKIKAKNKSLDEERAKRLAKEEAAKKEKEAEKGPKPEAQEDMIHPSRRGQVPNNRRR